MTEHQSPTPAELLREVERLRTVVALATVLEIPRSGLLMPLQLIRSFGHTDRWAICDRTGRRWARDGGWYYEPPRDQDCDSQRFTFAEALPLAHTIAAGTAVGATQPPFCPPCRRGDCEDCMAVDHPNMPNLYGCLCGQPGRGACPRPSRTSQES